MNVRPVLDRQPDFDPQVLGYCMSAFYGGRAEVHHRKQSVPVHLVDFTSMYPTVVANMNIWSLVIADQIDTVEATVTVQALLDECAATRQVPAALWPQMVGVARTQPTGQDVLPIRAPYGEGPSHTIGTNFLIAAEPLWYAVADLAASAILTGTAPQVDRALQFQPVGVQPGLTSVRLRGETLVNPAHQDPFKTATEARQRIKAQRTGDHSDKCGCPECTQMAFLKTFANAGSYGIFAEINRNSLPAKHPMTVTVYSNRDQPWTTTVTSQETPGEYCFPPIAAAITAGARLMLALLEHQVTAASGSWVFCDTDSMAIIATQDGGRIEALATNDPNGTTVALSAAQVDEIIDSFAPLNPYEPDAVPGSILRPVAHGQCHAISAKRYTMWSEGSGSNTVTIGKHTEHGLGHLINPYAPEVLESDDAPDWVAEVWAAIIADELNRPIPEPSWYGEVALSRYTISSPGLWAAFKTWNKGKPWAEQIKPFNFLLVAHVAKFNHPEGVTHLTLIAPYSNKPDEWATLPWRNRHDPDGPAYTITTGWTDDDQHRIGVQTYADILRNYRRHPEAKFADANGQPCTSDTKGQLHRRTIRHRSTRYIGKESDLLDEVTTGLTPAEHEPVTDYTPNVDPFTLVREVLNTITTAETIAIVHATQPSCTLTDPDLIRTVQRARKGSRPRGARRQLLEDVALHVAIRTLTEAGLAEKWVDLPTVALRQEVTDILTLWQYSQHQQ